jgi:hypothetical protein
MKKTWQAYRNKKVSITDFFSDVSFDSLLQLLMHRLYDEQNKFKKNKSKRIALLKYFTSTIKCLLELEPSSNRTKTYNKLISLENQLKKGKLWIYRNSL